MGVSAKRVPEHLYNIKFKHFFKRGGGETSFNPFLCNLGNSPRLIVPIVTDFYLMRSHILILTSWMMWSVQYIVDGVHVRLRASLFYKTTYVTYVATCLTSRYYLFCSTIA